ncbi:MAG: transcriptional repressor [Dehalococcoidia bacterium]|nr:transcriptional repressor [Dehalococcoidia bacterium]HCV00476.1 transcriptional repressor [Dehalococcoidia bacterium]
MTDSTERLEDTGYRLTAPRRAVLDAIASINRPFTIEELSEGLPNIGRATVFRTVKLLQELDIVCRVPLEDGSVRYERSRSGRHHHHLICSVCGSVTEFSDPSLDAAIEQNATSASFELESHSAELYGRCDSCRTTS